jgi:opacity protein-like surface antigen
MWRLTLVLALLIAPTALAAQSNPDMRVQVSAGGGFLTSGAYFTGPGALELASGDAFAGMLQVSVPVHRSLALVIAGAHARPEWRISGVPLVGAIGVSGARLWFADAAVRGSLPLGEASATAPVAFAQAGAGLAHYSLNTTIVGNAVDEDATNLALALGAGVALPITERVGLEVLAKDYIASFKSVRDLESLGIEGRRAHTLLLGVSARIGL